MGYYRSIGLSAVLLSTTAWLAPASAQILLETLFITATGRPEPISRIVGTTQIISRETIEQSTARSVTELLVENAVGFLGEWTPDQTQVVIRGANTEPQGRDFRSQVLILINGHRAGTGNISKLSLADVDRIEIVRGPSSVVYGSQNMGGVVNIIMKTGLTAPGTLVEGRAGSWDLFEGKLQNGGKHEGFDWYFGASGGKRDDYHIGGGRTEVNTSWERRGFTGSAGYQFDPNNHVGINMRADGIFEAGFRGSASSIFGIDNRYNRSYDVNYEGSAPGGRVSWFFQQYAVTDVDNLNNPNPLATRRGSTTGAGAFDTFTASQRTILDRNRRHLDIVGSRLQPHFKLLDTNDLLLGWDWERSWIRSTHDQTSLAGIPALVAPADNNQTENVNAFYFEDAQTFYNDRLTLRGGTRWTFGTTTLDPTPNVTGLIPGSTDYTAQTYSAGATWRATDWLLLRTGTSTGFRAPTASELGNNFTQATSGARTFGNPNLNPETSEQIEVGANVAWNGFQFDTALFQNIIHDRIRTRPRPGVANVSDTINNPGDVIIQGVEFQAQNDMLKTFQMSGGNWFWNIFGSGFYNFKMVDEGATPDVVGRFIDKPTRVSEYAATIGTRFGQSTKEPWRDWTWRIQGVLHGPQWYNTEESLDPAFFPLQQRTVTIYKKDPFWLLNSRFDMLVYKDWTAYVAVNNILDLNDHPTFIGIDDIPCALDIRSQNGGCGNSIPGREIIVGLRGRW